MLFKNTMCVLQEQRVVVIAFLKECNCQDRWNGGPDNEILHKKLLTELQDTQKKQGTLRSLRRLESSLSPTKNLRASGTPSTSRMFDRTNFPTSICMMGILKRSVRDTAIAGSTFHAFRTMLIQEAWREPLIVAADSRIKANLGHSSLYRTKLIESTPRIVTRVHPHRKAEKLVVNQHA